MNAPFHLDPKFLDAAPASVANACLETLLKSIERNRFLPEPDPANVFVGDGNYRAIGTEYLGHYVRIGGLKPTDRVLDIGCGIGRMAVPLTQYLDETACYEGIDPVNEGIEWCVQNVSRVYPNFRFCRVDIAHDLYNPGGAVKGTEIVLPFGDAKFDFVTMISVATHLPLEEIAAYAREVSRLLAPGGKLFLTAFLVSEGDPDRAEARPQFQPGAAVGSWIADPAAPLGAIGFDMPLIPGVLQEAGLRIDLVSPGHWRGMESAHYQDVIIAVKPEDAA
jgi:SAM-dependent methyltransferase